MGKITVTIDGKVCTGNAGDTILKIAQENGIHIPTLCFHEKVAIYGACGVCLVEAEGNPKLLRSCSITATDGQVIHTDSDRVKQARKVAVELLMSDHNGDCVGPCSLNCPAGTDCQGYVKEISRKNYHGAVQIIKEKFPLPASIGRVCPHPCEKACRRQYAEESISIANLKAFAADRDLEDNPYRPEKKPATGKKVAVIGGGPAGLTCAYYLALNGHDTTVFEALPQMGGMLRYGIPEYRLPKAVLDREIEEIAYQGIHFVNNTRIGTDLTLAQLRKDYDAVVIAVGAWKSTKIGCKGEDLDGVIMSVEFLQSLAFGERPYLGKNVAIVGGGNTAMDACRSAVRLGAEHVYVFYRRTRAEMPAEDVEVSEAIEEGVDFHFLTNPAEIIGENGKVKQIKLQVMELGAPDASGRRSPVAVEGKFETIDVDTVIAAIGHKADVAFCEGIELNTKGIIAADTATFRTSFEGVFAIGDATNKGSDIAIAAIGEANKAAAVIDGYLAGLDISYRKPFVSECKNLDALKQKIGEREKLPRAKMPQRSAEERKHDFREINLGLSEEEAVREANRCLECGCHDYKDCKLIQVAREQEIHPERFTGEQHPGFEENRLVTIERNQNKCILCNLCVRTCDQNVGKGVLGLVGRGFTTVIKPEFRSQETLEFCKNCHQCADLCPTGALKILN